MRTTLLPPAVWRHRWRLAAVATLLAMCSVAAFAGAFATPPRDRPFDADASSRLPRDESDPFEPQFPAIEGLSRWGDAVVVQTRRFDGTQPTTFVIDVRGASAEPLVVPGFGTPAQVATCGGRRTALFTKPTVRIVVAAEVSVDGAARWSEQALPPLQAAPGPDDGEQRFACDARHVALWHRQKLLLSEDGIWSEAPTPCGARAGAGVWADGRFFFTVDDERGLRDVASLAPGETLAKRETGGWPGGRRPFGEGAMLATDRSGGVWAVEPTGEMGGAVHRRDLLRWTHAADAWLLPIARPFGIPTGGVPDGERDFLGIGFDGRDRLLLFNARYGVVRHRPGREGTALVAAWPRGQAPIAAASMEDQTFVATAAGAVILLVGEDDRPLLRRVRTARAVAEEAHTNRASTPSTTQPTGASQAPCGWIPPRDPPRDPHLPTGQLDGFASAPAAVIGVPASGKRRAPPPVIPRARP